MRGGRIRMPGPRALVAGVSLLAVVALALVDVRRTSPGELASSHASVADLQGRAGCATCHGGWGTTMTEACLDCHVLVGEDLETGRGLHGSLEGDASTCARCHSDHHGPDFALAGARSFRQAGFGTREDFDHGVLGFDMGGRHLELACAECHALADAPARAAGSRRFGGLEASCGACHDDAHPEGWVASCTACHGQERFDALASTPHDDLPLVGAHGAAACSDCHAERGPRSLRAHGRLPDRAPRGCVDCHEDPHAPAFVARVERGRLPGAVESCALCHDSVHGSFTPPEEGPAEELHALTGFPLAAPHAEVACEACHAPERAFEARYPGREADGCGACHDDPHGGQFAVDSRDAQASSGGATACVDCHDRAAFEPHAFTAARHADLELPLEGRHAELECGACHAPAADGARAFRGTPASCGACHADAHRGFFEAGAERCGDCHALTSFGDPGPVPFDHGGYTGLPLLGAHAQTGCEACHGPRAEPDATGRVLGWVPDHFGDYEGCSTCHEDPHRGRFDRPGLPAAVDGREDCARCHGHASFRALPEGFEHGVWTGFPLAGAHGPLDCGACHAARAPGSRGAGVLGPVRGTACADCHADPHARQFEEDGRTECSACHRSADAFDELVFDHAQTRFPLDEAHERVRCDECHKPWRYAPEVEAVRYRPLETDCAACHGTHAGGDG